MVSLEPTENGSRRDQSGQTKIIDRFEGYATNMPYRRENENSPFSDRH